MSSVQRAVIPSHVHYGEDEIGNTVVLNNKKGRIYGLYGVAALIWNLTAKGESEDNISSAIVIRYGIPRSTAESDVRKFLSRLAAAELVELSE